MKSFILALAVLFCTQVHATEAELSDAELAAAQEFYPETYADWSTDLPDEAAAARLAKRSLPSGKKIAKIQKAISIKQ